MTVQVDVHALISRHIATLHSVGAPPRVIDLYATVWDEDMLRCTPMFNVPMRGLLLNVIGEDKVIEAMFDSLITFRQHLVDRQEKTTWPQLIDAVMEWKKGAV